MNKEYYSNFKSFITDLTNQEKSIRADISSYKETIGKGANTRDIEEKIKNSLKSFKDLVDKLNDAYLSKNAPGNMPEATLDSRQKEIKKFKISYDDMTKDFKLLEGEKYSFKGHIEEDYKNKEEYKGMSAGELLEVQQKKLNEQDDKIDDIVVDAKKGTQLAKNLGHELKEQNKKIEVVNEDMDRVDSRMNKLTKRFEKYVAQSSTCCLSTFLFFDVALFIGLIIVFVCVKDGEVGWEDGCPRK